MPFPRRKRFLVVVALAVAALTTLVLGGLGGWVLSEKWKWQTVRAELLARHETLDLAAFAPARPPDDENFFGDPIWKELADVVERTSASGQTTLSPRLAEGKRRIDALDPVLPPALADLAGELVPLTKPPRVSTTIHAAARKIPDTDDPAKRADLARLILATRALSAAPREHLDRLLDRPHADFPTGIERGLDSLNIAHTIYLLHFTQSESAAALAHLTLWDPTAATHDIITGLRLSGTLSSERPLISLLVRRAMLGRLLELIDRGITRHAWSEANLAAFEPRLAAIDLLLQLRESLRCERALANHALDEQEQTASKRATFFRQLADFHALLAPEEEKPSPLERTLLPYLAPLFFRSDLADYNRFVQQLVDAMPGSSVNPAAFPRPADLSRMRLTHVLTDISRRNLRAAALSLAHTQERVVLTRLAIALERARLCSGRYPNALSSLTPDFLGSLPADVLAGQDLRYSPGSGDTFRLWSVGWNGVDDHAAVASDRQDFESADWVWPHPPGSTSDGEP